MEIKITTNTPEHEERVFSYIKIFCNEHFRKFTLEIVGTDLKHEQKEET